MLMLLTSSLGREGDPLTTRRSRAVADTYHHGNLRQALLEHAVELARTGGPDAVVLRDVQRMAGVSNSAAYRHYADRDALLAAVTDYAETRLADAMVARMNAVANRGPKARRALARLRATGQGYIDFALAEPGLFRTAFAPSGSARGGHTRQTDGAEPLGKETPSVPDPDQVYRRSGRRRRALRRSTRRPRRSRVGRGARTVHVCFSTARSVRPTRLASS